MILDTNALSALADGDEGLAEKMESVSVPSRPSIVMGEFRYGMMGSNYHPIFPTLGKAAAFQCANGACSSPIAPGHGRPRFSARRLRLPNG